MFDGELSFALKLAREMGRPDWRAMLAGMSSTEYADWHRFYSKRKLTAVCSHQTRIGNLDAHLI
nr:phage tail assembly protein T [Escherichia coli]